MGTEVLQAQDCLDLHRRNEHHGFMGAVYYGGAKLPKKSQSPNNRKKAHGSPPQKPSYPKGGPEFQEKKRPFKAAEFQRSLKNQNHQRKGNSEPTDFAHVTILKRGQSLESKGHMMGRLGVSPPKSGDLSWIQRSVSAESGKLTRLPRSVSAGFKQPFPEEWAGPGFANSPSPRCLPLPKFPVKKASADPPLEVYNCATRDLRRLLGLD